MTTDTATSPTCQLSLPEGSALADGRVHRLSAMVGGQRLTVIVDRPYALLQACLLGARRQLCVAYEDGPRRRATVEELYFAPSLGRVCVLAVQPAPSVDPRIQSGG